MTRYEEIRNAIDTIVPIPISENGRTYEQALIATGFEKGVKWSDEHPKNPWISVHDKLPFECEETRCTENVTKPVLVNTCSCEKILAYMLIINDIWEWRAVEGDTIDLVTHWMPIPNIDA